MSAASDYPELNWLTELTATLPLSAREARRALDEIDQLRAQLAYCDAELTRLRARHETAR